ncbi:MAG: hypothetical protein M3N37_10235 [Actinomycetota bacterium]|nr:hypothetical protein [Actinomycetota bacterium]
MAGRAASGAGAASPRRGLRLAQLLTLGDQTDEHGRLLLEDSAPRQAQKRVKRAGVAMSEARCDYADSPSRLGGRMNVSAYDSLRRDTAEVLHGFAWLAELRAAAKPDPGRGTLGSLIDVANLGTTLPLVLFHRVHDPVPAQGVLPAFIASIFKASRGLFSGAVAMLNDDDREASTAVTTEEVVTYAEQHGQFRRTETQRVCAAPTRLIARTIEAVLTGEGADASRSRLGDHLHADALWRFFSLHESFSQALSTYRFVLDNLTAERPEAGPEELFSVTVAVAGRTGTFGDLTEALAHHGTEVQAGLNEVLGRSGEVPPLTLPALLRLL